MTKADRAKMKALEDSHRELINRCNETKSQWNHASNLASFLRKQVETQEAELETSNYTIQDIRRSIKAKDALKRNDLRQRIEVETHGGMLRSLTKQLRDLGGDV